MTNVAKQKLHRFEFIAEFEGHLVNEEEDSLIRSLFSNLSGLILGNTSVLNTDEKNNTAIFNAFMETYASLNNITVESEEVNALKYLDLCFESFLNYNIEIIELNKCLKYIPSSSRLHKRIFEYHKNNNFFDNLNIFDQANFVLLLGFLYDERNIRRTVKRYVKLVDEKHYPAIEKYLANNFEMFFENIVFNVSVDEECKQEFLDLKKSVLIDKTYSYVSQKVKTPHHHDNLLGENQKYYSMNYTLLLFSEFALNAKPEKNPYLSSKKFCFTLGRLIHNLSSISEKDQKIIKIEAKKLLKKYNLSSISWSNDFFEHSGMSPKEYFEKLNNGFEKAQKILKIDNLDILHLTLTKSLSYDTNAFFINETSLFKNKPYNCHTLNIAHIVEDTIEGTILHELTHFVHSQEDKKKNMKNNLWRKILEVVYLRDEKDMLIENLSSSNLDFTQKEIVISFFQEYSHLDKEDFFKNYKEFVKPSLSAEEHKFILDEYQTFKRKLITESEQYKYWDEISADAGSDGYYNFQHEVHARLNELFIDQSLFDNDEYVQEETFNSLKNLLLEFNHSFNNLTSQKKLKV